MTTQQIILTLFLAWGSPIGLAIFLAGVGVYYWGRGAHRRAEAEAGRPGGAAGAGADVPSRA